MEQFTKLIEFRQAIYEYGLIRTKDAQFELVDALLLSPVVRSFPELSLCPAFRRQWTSAYEAIRKGLQNQGWLERYFMRLVPTIGSHVFSLDGTAWPVLAENAHPFKDPPRKTNSPFGLFGLTS